MAKESIKYLLSLILFGTNGIVASHIDLPSHQIVFIRTFLGALLLAALVLLRHGGATIRQHPRQAAAVAVSGAALGIGWLFLFEAYKLVGVSIASLAYYCGPVIVIALSPLLFHERLTLAKVMGIIVVDAGAILVVAKGGTSLNPLGLIFGFLSAVMYTVMVVYSRKGPDIDGLESAAVQIAASFAVVAVYQLIRFIILPSELGQTTATLPHMNWLAALTIGCINTGLGCYLYFSSIGRLDVGRVAIWGYLEPLSAVVLSTLILGEPVTLGRTLGAALIVGGAIFSELAGSHEKNKQTSAANLDASASPSAHHVATKSNSASALNEASTPAIRVATHIMWPKKRQHNSPPTGDSAHVG